ncbi:MAG: cyclase family protein, partial [bacterium]
MGAATPEWPGDQPFHCGWTCRRENGDSVNLAAVTTSFHVGTHADAPLHVADGAPGADALPLAPFIGPATVVDVRQVDGVITSESLRAGGCPDGVERLILRTDRTVASGQFP